MSFVEQASRALDPGRGRTTPGGRGGRQIGQARIGVVSKVGRSGAQAVATVDGNKLRVLASVGTIAVGDVVAWLPGRPGIILGPVLGALDPLAETHIAVGFGAGVTGGAGYPEVEVTTLADSGTGSLREALSGGNRQITVASDVAGDTKLLTELALSDVQNVTLDLGGRILLAGARLKFANVDNLLIKNLLAGDGDGDCLAIQSSSGATRDITFAAIGLDIHGPNGDGSFDITRAYSNKISGTISFSRFREADKTMLINSQSGGGVEDGASYEITIHHSLWSDNNQRQPLIGNDGYLHYFGNVVERYGDEDGNGAGVATRGTGQALVEGNVAIPRSFAETTGFDGATVTDPRDRFSGQVSGETDAFHRSENNDLQGIATEREQFPTSVPDPSYDYDAELIDSLESYVREHAGPELTRVADGIEVVGVDVQDGEFNTSPISLSLPSSWAPGDLALIFVSGDGNLGLAVSDYDEVEQVNHTGGRSRTIAAFSRVLQDGDSDPSVTNSTAGSRCAHLVVLHNVHDDEIVADSATLEVVNDPAPTPAGCWAPTSSAVLTYHSVTNLPVTSYAAPDGYELISSNESGFHRQSAVAALLDSGKVGDEAPGAWQSTTSGPSEDSSTLTLSVRPSFTLS